MHSYSSDCSVIFYFITDKNLFCTDFNIEPFFVGKILYLNCQKRLDLNSLQQTGKARRAPKNQYILKQDVLSIVWANIRKFTYMESLEILSNNIHDILDTIQTFYINLPDNVDENAAAANNAGDNAAPADNDAAAAADVGRNIAENVRAPGVAEHAIAEQVLNQQDAQDIDHNFAGNVIAARVPENANAEQFVVQQNAQVLQEPQNNNVNPNVPADVALLSLNRFANYFQGLIEGIEPQQNSLLANATLQNLERTLNAVSQKIRTNPNFDFKLRSCFYENRGKETKLYKYLH